MYPKMLLMVENLSVCLKGQTVLKGIDWQIGKAEQWVVLGPNGSGKTSLVKAIAGILPSAGGRIVFSPSEDRDGEFAPRKNRIGFASAEAHRKIFERESLTEEIRHFTGDSSKVLTTSDFVLNRSENIEAAPAISAELSRMSAEFDMQATLEKSVSALTSGEINKILILKALIYQPQVLILDEIFNGLDQRSKASVAQLIRDLIRKGLQVILITHRIDEILPEISHVLVMTKDGVQQSGPKEEVLRSNVLQRIYRIDSSLLDPEAQKFTKTGPNQVGRRPNRVSKNRKRFGTKLIEMTDVNVQYGQRFVLKNVNWTIYKGENWIVCGPDGSGKTTLLKLITGENLQAYANDIFLFGQKKGSGESVWEIKKKIGWIASDLQAKYPANIKGMDVVCSGFFDSVGLYRTATVAQKKQAERTIRSLGIQDLIEKVYGGLSHGQKQMLLIARALVKSPPLLLLDEPCAGLDFYNREKMIEIIDYIGNHTETTIVYATCDDYDTLSCVDRQLILKENYPVASAMSPQVYGE